MQMRRILIATALSVVCVPAVEAAEQPLPPTPQEVERQCHDYTQRADTQITACTRIIGLYANSTGNRALQAIALLARGSSYSRTGDRAHALADYREAIRLDTIPIEAGEKDVALYNDRCWARAIAGLELDMALADCNEALRLKADFVPALDSRAFLQLRRNRFRDAVRDYDVALKQNGMDPYSLFGRGVAKMRIGDTDGAKADLTAASAAQQGIAAEYLSYGVTP
jgi:tetratricopeptide (TPR) repeat protein